MEKRITGVIHVEGARPYIRRVREWGDPVLVSLLGADAGALDPPSNFQVVKLFDVVNGFNDIAGWQRFPYPEYFNILKDLQIDDYADSGYTIDQKMNWLVNLGGDTKAKRPYWVKPDDKWMYFGHFVFGGQLVQLEAINNQPVEYWFRTKYPGEGGVKDILFYKLIGINKSDIGKVMHKTHPWLVQKATSADGKNNTYSDYVKGNVYHYVWGTNDFPSNGGDMYLAAEFLE